MTIIAAIIADHHRKRLLGESREKEVQKRYLAGSKEVETMQIPNVAKLMCEGTTHTV